MCHLYHTMCDWSSFSIYLCSTFYACFSLFNFSVLISSSPVWFFLFLLIFVSSEAPLCFHCLGTQFHRFYCSLPFFLLFSSFFLFLLLLHPSSLSKEFVFSTCVKGRLQATLPSTSLCSQKSPWLSTLLGVKNLWKETKIIVLVLSLSFYISLLKTKSPQELKCYINGLYHEN